MKQKKENFVFDLHNVLFTVDYVKAFNNFIAIPNKLLLFRTCLKPRLISQFLKIYKKSRVSEEYIASFMELFPHLELFAPYGINLVNSQKPIIPIIEYIHTLKRCGKKTYIFSNIGEQTFEKLKMEHNDIFSSFDGIHTTQKENNWLQKPSEKAFTTFLEKFNIDPKTMVFVDDGRQNVKTAQSLNIHAIHFKNSKQCLEELKLIE